ncbi:hypothetical protein I317_06874 [Kwoniella heveanensis CBS 569]|uniref:Uncharacterized protein n=1 Tax=Kwoniella heveanensis BCC8398 TaxID=1296120 RepID=A0A1B9H1X5_9TREE|nr:hypothetical protein I316_01188 [Kwoniella heveanensis BCC8398]OCF39339.1 hypothetical protein I317_06874 [Kwoniella heveanensis CBS 569]
MSSDDAFVNTQSNIPETGQDVAAEDRRVEESEATGKISQQEVADLKDDLSANEELDSSEGYTRSSNKDNNPLKQEEEVDAAVQDLE